MSRVLTGLSLMPKDSQGLCLTPKGSQGLSLMPKGLSGFTTLSQPRAHQAWAPPFMWLRHCPRRKLTSQLPPCSIQIPMCFPSLGLRRREMNLPTVPCHLLLLFCPYDGSQFGEMMTEHSSHLGSGSAHIIQQNTLLDKLNSPKTFSVNHMALWVQWFFLGFSTSSKGQPLAMGNLGPLPGSRSVLRRRWSTPQRPLASPKHQHQGLWWGRREGAFGWKRPQLKRTNCADSKKIFFQKCLWVNLSCPQLPRGISNLLPSHFCGFQSNPNFSVH